MLESLGNIIKKTNTWKLTIFIAFIAVGLTNGLNLLYSLLIGVPLNTRLVVFGSLDAILIPFAVGPFVINTYKRAATLMERNLDLEKEIGEQRYVGEAAQKRASHLALLNELSLESSLVSVDTDFVKRIAEKLHAITKSLAVSISLYEPERGVLITKHISVPEGLLKEATRYLGFDLIGMSSPVSPEMHKRMTSEVATTATDLSELTAGKIPGVVSDLFRSIFKVGSFTALAFLNQGQLWGAAVIANRENQEPLDPAVAKIISQVIAVTLQRYEAEQRLQKREARLRLITDNMADIVSQVDEEQKIIYASPSAARMIGWNPNEINGQPYLSFIHPDDVSIVEEETNQARKVKAASMRMEFRLRKIDGGYIWTESTARLLYKADGTSAGAVIGTRNIDERKVVENERRKLILELAAKNKELEQFTYSVSHDLRSPLITIKGFLGYIRKDLANQKYDRLDQDAARVEETAEKMQRLLDELLELSRIGRMMKPPQKVAFESVVAEAQKLVRGQLQLRAVQVVVGASLPVVFGDQTRLVQMTQNLMENAVKFMGTQPEPVVEIGTRGNDPDGKAVLYVKDNGIGIEPQNMERIFDLFSKLDPSQEGSGIGLAMVKRIVELHGGRIWVESEGMGKGTCFWFTLEGSH